MPSFNSFSAKTTLQNAPGLTPADLGKTMTPPLERDLFRGQLAPLRGSGRTATSGRASRSRREVLFLGRSPERAEGKASAEVEAYEPAPR